MIRTLLLLAPLVLLSACASVNINKTSGIRIVDEHHIVTHDTPGRDFIQAVPPEAVLERFDMVEASGRRISYVALTDTEVGGLVFVDNTLLGTISKTHAHAFYSCRGYATSTGRHWAADADAWVVQLLASATPVDEVALYFSGKPVLQSISAVSGHAMVGQLRALMDTGGSPWSVVKSLGRARSRYIANEKYENVLLGLRSVLPGEPESRVAEVARPEDLAFVPGGFLMAYQRFQVEFYLTEGKVKVLQQPSFHQLSRTYAGLFYLANTRWSACTPESWTSAVSEITHRDVPSYPPAGPPAGAKDLFE
jgi:hypothetical protein